MLPLPAGREASTGVVVAITPRHGPRHVPNSKIAPIPTHASQPHVWAMASNTSPISILRRSPKELDARMGYVDAASPNVLQHRWSLSRSPATASGSPREQYPECG
jgi:hypothetical protein